MAIHLHCDAKGCTISAPPIRRDDGWRYLKLWSLDESGDSLALYEKLLLCPACVEKAKAAVGRGRP